MSNAIIIVDYGLGNLASVANALKKLEIPYQISSDFNVLKKANAFILPGVGAAGQGMKNLKKRGLDKVIIREIKRGKPLLGICLGMQLLLSSSEEGNVNCLGLIEGEVRKFNTSLKVPQIGWNQVQYQKSNIKDQKKWFGAWSLFNGIPNNSYFYFVNSYYCISDDKSIVVGKTEYGEEFASMVVKENIIGVQFHPEKSGKVGQIFLRNIISYLMLGINPSNLR